MTNLANLTICPMCAGHVSRVTGQHTVNCGNRQIQVTASLQQCASCGEVFFAPGELSELQKAASQVARSQEGLLMPEEVKSIRMKLGLSQSQLEKLIGTGPKTVIRWEKGTVFQSKVADTLLRLLDSLPSAVEFLSKEMGVPVQPTGVRQMVYQSFESKRDEVPIVSYLITDDTALHIRRPLSQLAQAGTR